MLIRLGPGRVYDTAGTVHTRRPGVEPPEVTVQPVGVLRGEDALTVWAALVDALGGADPRDHAPLPYRTRDACLEDGGRNGTVELLEGEER